MKIHLRKWMKSALAVSLLMGVSLLQANIMVNEQILPHSGGDSVAVDGEWAFVGDQETCQVYIYKYDYITSLWGDGGRGGDPIIASQPYTTLRATGGCGKQSIASFGWSLSSSNGLLVVGAPEAKDGGPVNHGRIFFYEYDPVDNADESPSNRRGWKVDDSVGSPLQRTGPLATDTDTDFQEYAAYGTSVSIRYNPDLQIAILTAGAPLYDYDPGGANEMIDAGKAYVYEWTPTGITFINGQSGENAGDQAGSAVTSNGYELLIGAPNYDNGTGAAYLFGYDLSDFSFTYEHRIRSGGYDTPQSQTPPFGYTFTTLTNTTFAAGDNMGTNLSYSDNTIAISGTDSLIYEHVHNSDPALGTFSFQTRVSATVGGDVTQDGSNINIAVKGASFNVYFDKTNIGSTPNVAYTKAETDYGRDISLNKSRLIVNGNENTTVYPDSGEAVTDLGVAYAYQTGCGVGGALKSMEWQMIGLQCDIYEDDPAVTKAGIAEIFSPSLGDYGSEWIMLRQKTNNYVGHNTDYDQMTAGESMEIGVGYWIISAVDKKFQVNNIGLSGNPIYGHNPSKQADPMNRSGVGAVTKLVVSTMMGGELAIGRGDVDAGGIAHSDFRVMFSNPLKVATDWDKSIFGHDGGSFYETASLHTLFENGDPTAWIYEPSTNWYIAVSTVPGMQNMIQPGQGYRILFSNTFWEDTLKSGATIPTLELDLAEAIN